MIIGTAIKIEIVRENIWSDGWIIINDYDGKIFGYATNDVIEGFNGEKLIIYFNEGYVVRFDISSFNFLELDYEYPNIINIPYETEDTIKEIKLKVVSYEGMNDELVNDKYRIYIYRKGQYQKNFRI